MFRNSDGQASVIGTIMAIMVVLAFLALITEQYIPVSMIEYEADHMEEVKNQFAQLRQTIDNQVIIANLGQEVDNPLFSDQSALYLYTPITLGSRSVPVFATQSIGSLSFQPNQEVMTVGFTHGTTNVEEYSSGMIELDVFNRYFESQAVAFTNGAISVSQDDGEVLTAGPHLLINYEGGEFTVEIMLIRLVGMEDSVQGAGSTNIKTHVEYVDYWQYTGEDVFDFNISFETKHPDAWYRYFEEVMSYELTDLSPAPVEKEVSNANRIKLYVNRTDGVPYYSLMGNNTHVMLELGGQALAGNMPVTDVNIMRSSVSVGIGVKAVKEL